MRIERKYNNDDVYFRALIISLLSFLNNQLKIWQIKDDNYEEKDVRFFYDAVGDERFLQDVYQSNDVNCDAFYLFDGDHKSKPYCVVSLETFSIDESQLTNRFIRGDILEQTKEGDLLSYSAPLNMVPIIMNFKCEIHYDSQLESFKLIQNIIRTFHKAHKIKFQFEDMLHGATIGMAVDIDREKRTEFTYGDRKEDKISFNIETNSYLPVMDETRKFSKSNSMEEINIQTTLNQQRFFTPTLIKSNIDGEDVIIYLPNSTRII